MVGSSAGGFAFVEVKHALNFSTASDSTIARVIGQYARQFLSNRSTKDRLRPWQRPLQPQLDRLVLVAGIRSSAPIRQQIPDILSRVRKLVPGQVLEDGATNQEERRILTALLDHCRQAWRVSLGIEPTSPELHEFLSLWRIEILDLDPGGTSEVEAKRVLRQILRDPDNAEAAWKVLIETCAQLARAHTGADRPTLQNILLQTGFLPDEPRSYRTDIQALRDYTQRTVNALINLSRIRAGTTHVKLHRSSTRVLAPTAEGGSLLVVGEPGAGKSGALHDVVQNLKDGGRDVVFLAVDRLMSATLPGLQQVLGLGHELSDVLLNWPGSEPAFLVIDALDAARGEPEARSIRELIASVIESSSRWRVIASIRRFDLEYSQETKRLFAGELPPDVPAEVRDTKFPGLRCIKVPLLTDPELAEVSLQAPPLGLLIATAPERLAQLLRVPFNLRLLAELLAGGLGAPELITIKTQLQLLDRYWRHWVIAEDQQGDARELILRHSCEQMVADRVLRVDRATVAHRGDVRLLHDLLSKQILVEWQPSPQAAPERYILAFAHHVLFDYAAARLLLRGDSAVPLRRLETDPELSLVIRPSIIMHFHHLWALDDARTIFWELVFRIVTSPELPEISKLIGPSVAANLARSLSDIEPLTRWLSDPDQNVRGGAELVLQHLAGALLAALPDDSLLVGPNAGPWCEMLEILSLSFQPSIAYSARSLITAVCEAVDKLSQKQVGLIGKASRRLLEFAWRQMPRDQWLVVHALLAVCRTFQTDVEASSNLIRRSLEPRHLNEFAPEEAPWISREIQPMFVLDPVLAKDIYIAYFQLPAPADTPMPLGPPSRIFSMQTNSRQEIEGARYQLARTFPTFLKAAPTDAAVAAVEVFQSYVVREHASSLQDGDSETFQFSEHTARVVTDHSSIWDFGGISSQNEASEILDAFIVYLETLSSTDDPRGLTDELLHIIVSRAYVAGIWRRLLRAATQAPNTLGRRLLPLTLAEPILRGLDTTYEAGEFLKAVFSDLTASQRKNVEDAILTLTKSPDDPKREWLDQVRGRLLGCLPMDLLVTEGARSQLASLESSNKVPKNEPLFRVGPVHSSPYGEEAFLRDRGVEIESPANQRIRDLERPVTEFTAKHRHSVPSIDALITVYPELKALREFLATASREGAHTEQIDFAWGNLAEACEVAVKVDSLGCDDSVGHFLQTTILEASQHQNPQPNPNADSQFDEFLSWGGPSPRISAAAGIMLLARHPKCFTSDVHRTIENLTGDPVPAVRFQIVTNLTCLYKTAPEFMWQILSRVAKEENSRGVLSGMMTSAVGRLAAYHPDSVSELTSIVFERFADDPKAAGIRASCANLYSGLYVWQGHQKCRTTAQKIVDDPLGAGDLAQSILFGLREPLTQGSAASPDPHDKAIRERAFDLLTRLVASTRRELDRIESQNPSLGFTSWPPSDREAVKNLSKLLDHVAKEVYFASGAFREKNRNQEGRNKTLGNEERVRFYHDAGSILSDLANVGIPSIAHSVLETLESFIEFDPRGVFVRVGSLVNAGRRSGYQYEPLAAGLVVNIVERYLAEYRTLLQESSECRRLLMDLLDVFVRAGWPSARRITYQLEEIFR
jgi:hypothetical protein